MRIATPGPARARLLLLATLVLVLGGGSIWMALGTAQPLEAPALPPAHNTVLPFATLAPQVPASPTSTVTPSPAPTATTGPASLAGRAEEARNLGAAGHNNRPGAVVRYLHRGDPLAGHAGWWPIGPQPAMLHGDVSHVYAT
jgi:hypothetical protein